MAEVLLHDRSERCPYLSDQVARMPGWLQMDPITGPDLDRRLDQGERRTGRTIYTTRCASCQACQALRIPILDFQPGRSHRRVIRRNRDVEVTLHAPCFSYEKLDLFNRHGQERSLQARGPLGAGRYQSWLVESCTLSREFRYCVGGRLVGLGIVDFGQDALNSVYFYYDPAEAWRSLGVFSVLCELDLARRFGARFLYLGYYVEGCRPMTYKAAFGPHERRVDGVWRRFEQGPQWALSAP